MQYRYFPDKDQAVLSATEYLCALLHQYKDTQVLLLVSGGSAFAVLNGVLREALGPHVTIGVLDERFSVDPAVNNFSLLTSLPFFKLATEARCLFIDTCLTHDTIDLFADHLQKTLRDWRKSCSFGKIIITQGIGSDGHTAGIMPFPEDASLFGDLFEGVRWIVGYDAGSKNEYPLRVTATNTFLRDEVDHSVVLATGVSKKKPLQQIFCGETTLPEIPAGILKEMKDVSVFTDQPFPISPF